MKKTSPSIEAQPHRQKLERLGLQAVRAYTYNTPIKKGTYRLFMMALKLCRYPHVGLPARTTDGRSLSVDLTSGMEEPVFFHGEYEPVLTLIAARLIGRGDVCLDVGANFGWYTTLFATLVGDKGSVHAFEPVPRMFGQLTDNYQLLEKPDHVFINKAALGNKCGLVTVNLFDGKSTGHASISDQGQKNIEGVECQLITLDSYLLEKNIPNVDFVKVDIEGGELMFLEGARRLFAQGVPPIFLMEMSRELGQHFGYLPNDLLAFLNREAEYYFYSVDETRGRVRQITAFDPEDIGANVFCIPAAARDDKHEAISKFLDT